MGWVWWLAFALAVTGALAWIVWWGLVGRPASRTEANVAAVVNEPSLFAGRTITVVGRWGGPVGDSGFALEGEAGERLLVVREPGVELPQLPSGAAPLLEATGEVLVLDEQGLERLRQAGSSPPSGWEGRPALLARRVELDVVEP